MQAAVRLPHRCCYWVLSLSLVCGCNQSVEYNPSDQASGNPDATLPAAEEATLPDPADSPLADAPPSDPPPQAPVADPPGADPPGSSPEDLVDNLDAFFGDSAEPAPDEAEEAGAAPTADDAADRFGELLAGGPTDTAPPQQTSSPAQPPLEEPQPQSDLPASDPLADPPPIGLPPSEQEPAPAPEFDQLFDQPSEQPAEALPPAEAGTPDGATQRPLARLDDPTDAVAEEPLPPPNLPDPDVPEPDSPEQDAPAPDTDWQALLADDPPAKPEEAVPPTTSDVADSPATGDEQPAPPFTFGDSTPLPDPEPAQPPAKRPSLNVNNTRHLAWTLGARLGLDVMRPAPEDPWQQQAIAEMLGVELPPIEWDGTPADKAARVLKAARVCGQQLADKYGTEHAALMELAVKSATLATLYESQPELAQAAESVIKDAAQRTRLAPSLVTPLVELLQAGATAAQVQGAVLDMQTGVEQSLREADTGDRPLW